GEHQRHRDDAHPAAVTRRAVVGLSPGSGCSTRIVGVCAAKAARRTGDATITVDQLPGSSLRTLRTKKRNRLHPPGSGLIRWAVVRTVVPTGMTQEGRASARAASGWN